MFGYVRPLRAEMKVREYEQFKSAYCGLCHTLGRQYGALSRYLLNYDFTFLAIVLSGVQEEQGFERLRCPASPLRKKYCVKQSGAYEKAAAISMILTWWKLRDHVQDGRLPEKAVFGLLCLILKPAYRKAARLLPEYERQVKDSLSLLDRLEKERCASIDEPADTFASCLSAAADTVEKDSLRRPLKALFYHIGRWIYIMDAFDDCREDIRRGLYNPLAQRYDLVGGDIPEPVREQVSVTARHSLNLACDAFELIEFTHSREILHNILCLGLPMVQKQVLAGTWKKGEKHERPV